MQEKRVKEKNQAKQSVSLEVISKSNNIKQVEEQKMYREYNKVVEILEAIKVLQKSCVLGNSKGAELYQALDEEKARVTFEYLNNKN